jgi:hypothetical protein
VYLRLVSFRVSSLEIEALTEYAMSIIAQINKIRRKAAYRELLPLEVHVQTIIQLLSTMYTDEWSGRERAWVEQWIGDRLDYVRCKLDTKCDCTIYRGVKDLEWCDCTIYRGVKDLEWCWEVIQPSRKRLRSTDDDLDSTESVSSEDTDSSGDRTSDVERSDVDSCLSDDEGAETLSHGESQRAVTINLIDDEAEEELEW